MRRTLNEERVVIKDFKDASKEFIKSILKNPSNVSLPKFFSDNGITKLELIKKLKENDILVSKENISEVPVDDTKKDGKMRSKRTIKYTVPRKVVEDPKFYSDKMDKMFKELFTESRQVFANENDEIQKIINMDYDGAYRNRGGYGMPKKLIRMTEGDLHRIIGNIVEEIISEDGEGGATSCQGVMQGGGSNPSAGQYDVPFGADNETKKRSKDFKNGSMMMQKAPTLSKPIYKPKN